MYVYLKTCNFTLTYIVILCNGKAQGVYVASSWNERHIHTVLMYWYYVSQYVGNIMYQVGGC